VLVINNNTFNIIYAVIKYGIIGIPIYTTETSAGFWRSNLLEIPEEGSMDIAGSTLN
jgi:hypothetical protein